MSLAVFQRRLFISLLALISLLLLGSPARADEENGSPIPRNGFTLGFGVNDTNPGYVGYNHQLTPFPFFSYRNGRFFLAGITAGYVVAKDSGYSLSLMVRPRYLRLKASDSPQLAGLATRQISLDGGAVLSVFGRGGRLNLGLFHDLLNRNKGTEASLGYSYPIHLRSWTLSPGLGIIWESASLTNYYYGVSPAEALPTRPAYAPGAATNPYVGLGLFIPLTPRWRFFSQLRYTRFDTTIQHSPIVDTSHSLSATVALGYTF
ncbi:MAG: MipA/OmpV family protein [Gammaproteobacteria bacterium]